MKTKVRFFMLCLVFAGFSWGMSAQIHLDALVKKCETLKSVDMEVIKNKRKTDKNAEIKTVNIRITNDKKLVSEFLNAFKKDASDAEQAMFKKEKNGEINHYQCRFSDRTYTIVIREAENANVTVGNHIRYHFGQFSSDPIQWNQQNDRMKQQIERQKEQTERQKKQMERQKDWMKQQMKHQKQQMKLQKERMKLQLKRNKYPLSGLDSIFIKHNTIADSLILKSSVSINSIDWDSITSKFGKDLDSVANKLGVGWDEIMKKYRFK